MKKYWKIKNKSERIRLRKYYKKIRRQHRLNKKKIELNNHIDQMFNNYNFLFNNFINKKYKPTYKKDKLNTIVETMPKIFYVAHSMHPLYFSVFTFRYNHYIHHN